MVTFLTARLKISFLQFYLRQLATLWLQYLFVVSSCVTGVCVYSLCILAVNKVFFPGMGV